MKKPICFGLLNFFWSKIAHVLVNKKKLFLQQWSINPHLPSHLPSPVELVIYLYVLCGTLDFIGKGGRGVERIAIEMTRKDLASLGLFD